MIPKKIHRVWHGNAEIPAQHQRWMASFIDLNPNWEFRLWRDSDFTADSRRLWKSKFNHPASISNYTRLCVLRNEGGIYVDTDVECLKPLDELLQHSAFVAEQDQVDGKPRYCNAVMGAEPNHPWIDWQLAHLEEYASHDAAWGVYAASAAPMEGVTAIDPKLVYPWHYHDVPEKRIPHPDSLMVHH